MPLVISRGSTGKCVLKHFEFPLTLYLGRTQAKNLPAIENYCVDEIMCHQSSVTILWQLVDFLILWNTTTSRKLPFNNAVEKSRLENCSILLGHTRN